jgi:hypothetical protein
LNVIRLLRESSAAEATRREPLRALQSAAREARAQAIYLDGDAAGQVFARALEPKLDQLVSATTDASAIGEATATLSQLFGVVWDTLGERCRRFLRTAEVLHAELKRREGGDDLDYGPSVHSYSRALEAELVDRLFEPFRASERHRLPDVDPAESDLVRSVDQLRRFIDRPTSPAPTLDRIAYFLANVGGKLADAPENDFAAFLSRRLHNREQFCREFPPKLHRYIGRYRNRAAHIEEISREEAASARAYLLDEPMRLLVELAESLR